MGASVFFVLNKYEGAVLQGRKLVIPPSEALLALDRSPCSGQVGCGWPLGRTRLWCSRFQNRTAALRSARTLTFNEPDRARPELAGQILRVILLEGLHKKNGSSTLSGARVAKEASKGRSLKLGCAMCCRGRSLGKRSCSLKLCDWPALPKTY